jgi:hypothetical protein
MALLLRSRVQTVLICRVSLWPMVRLVTARPSKQLHPPWFSDEVDMPSVVAVLRQTLQSFGTARSRAGKQLLSDAHKEMVL